MACRLFCVFLSAEASTVSNHFSARKAQTFPFQLDLFRILLLVLLSLEGTVHPKIIK